MGFVFFSYFSLILGICAKFVKLSYFKYILYMCKVQSSINRKGNVSMCKEPSKIESLRDAMIKEQEKALSFKSACEGMGLKEDSNSTEHLLRDRNRDISALNKVLRDRERTEMQKLTKPPKSLFYTGEGGQRFIDEAYAKRREKKAFWGGVVVTALAAFFFVVASKKKGGDEE